MKVILKEDVQDLGTIGTVLDVANGYGRNYLIPRKLAVEANPKNIRQFEHQKNMILAKAKKVRSAAEQLSDKLSGISLCIEVRAGEEDKLFGSVTTKDIAEAISKQGVEIDKRKILLDEPIKRIGTYKVTVKLPQDVTASVNIEVKKADSSDS